MNFKDKIIYHMKRKNITGLELSKLSEISPQYFTNIKKGRKVPTFKLLNNLINNLSLLESEKKELVELWKEAKDPLYKKEENRLESQIIDVPLVGKVSAGRGYINFESRDEFIPFLNGSFIDYSKCFAMLVEGNSMEPKIKDGSEIVVNPEINSIEQNLNKIVVANLNDETYVKILKINNNRLYLESINPEYSDISIKTTDNLRIVGKVVEVRYSEFFK